MPTEYTTKWEEHVPDGFSWGEGIIINISWLNTLYVLVSKIYKTVNPNAESIP